LTGKVGIFHCFGPDGADAPPAGLFSAVRGFVEKKCFTKKARAVRYFCIQVLGERFPMSLIGNPVQIGGEPVAVTSFFSF